MNRSCSFKTVPLHDKKPWWVKTTLKMKPGEKNLLHFAPGRLGRPQRSAPTPAAAPAAGWTQSTRHEQLRRMSENPQRNMKHRKKKRLGPYKPGWHPSHKRLNHQGEHLAPKRKGHNNWMPYPRLPRPLTQVGARGFFITRFKKTVNSRSTVFYL